MPTKTRLFRAFAPAAIAATLSACSTAPAVAPKPSLQDLLSQAGQAAAAGQKEKAVTLWKSTATAYPADKTPWANIAQTRYEAGQYGEAIVNAQEVLVRDPNDKLANGIIAMSGLRLSTRALGDLSRLNKLVGPLRTETQELAKLLRESLGEPVLLLARQPGAIERDRTKVISQKKKPVIDETKADPFSALK